MGKGDIKTKRGKIWAGSFGVSRPHKKKTAPVKKQKKQSSEDKQEKQSSEDKQEKK